MPSILQGCDFEADQHYDQQEFRVSVPLPLCIKYFERVDHAHSRFGSEAGGQHPHCREEIMLGITRSEASSQADLVACICESLL